MSEVANPTIKYLFPASVTSTVKLCPTFSYSRASIRWYSKLPSLTVMTPLSIIGWLLKLYHFFFYKSIVGTTDVNYPFFISVGNANSPIFLILFSIILCNSLISSLTTLLRCSIAQLTYFELPNTSLCMSFTNFAMSAPVKKWVLLFCTADSTFSAFLFKNSRRLH